MPVYRLLLTDRTGVLFFFHEFRPLPAGRLKKIIHDETPPLSQQYHPTLESGFLSAVAGLAGSQGFKFNALEYATAITPDHDEQARNVIFSLDCDVFASEANLNARVHRALDQIVFATRSSLSDPNSFLETEQTALVQAFDEEIYAKILAEKAGELSNYWVKFFMEHQEFHVLGLGILSSSYSNLLYLPASACGREMPGGSPLDVADMNQIFNKLAHLPQVDPNNTNFVWAPDYSHGVCIRNLGVGPQILGETEPFHLYSLIEPGFVTYKALEELALSCAQILV